MLNNSPKHIMVVFSFPDGENYVLAKISGRKMVFWP